MQRIADTLADRKRRRSSMAFTCLPQRVPQPRHVPEDGLTNVYRQFIQVIESCRTVAIETQIRYGTCATATQR